MNNQQKSNQSNPPIIHIGPAGRRGGGGPMGARMHAEKPKHTKETLKRLLRYIGKSRTVLILLLAIMVAVTAAELLGPFFQANAIDTIRKDDAPETVAKRLEVYHASTEVLKDYYQKQGKLRTIEGDQPIENAFADILKAIGAKV